MENIISKINPIIYALLIYLASFFAPKQQIIIETTPKKIASSSAIIIAVPRNDTTPWGTTDKIGDHLYRTYVGNDPAMGTPEEILKALNNYRENHHVGRLNSDDRLCDLAKKRANDQSTMGELDSHKGLIEYMDDPNHWKELNVTSIGENASMGYVLTGVHLIEWVFDADEEHKSNQLKPDWNLACAGISNTTVDIVFGKR